MRTTTLLSILFILTTSCRAADGGGTDATVDAAADSWWHGGGIDGVDELDLLRGPDEELAADDLPNDNSVPTFATPPPVSLEMGTSLVLDLVPFLDDDEDGPFGLSIDWSADHVAVKALDDKQILIVAPVDWFGSEVIDLTVTDSGGLTAAGQRPLLQSR